jgi:hypothetical protein
VQSHKATYNCCDVLQVQQKLQELQETIQSGEKEILELAQQIDAFTKARDKDMSGELFQLEATLKDKEKCKAKVRLEKQSFLLPSIPDSGLDLYFPQVFGSSGSGSGFRIRIDLMRIRIQHFF